MKDFNSSGELVIKDETITQSGSPVNKNYVDAAINGIELPDVTAELAAKADKSFVDESISGLTPRLLDTVDHPDLSFSVVDDEGRRTWLEVAPDGGPTEHAKDYIYEKVDSDAFSFAVVDDEDRRTWLEVAPDGGPTEYARSLIGNTGGGTPVNIPDFPSADWAHWGDSNTDDRANKTSNWTNVLAGLTGANHYNGGYWGQGAENIAARQGGAPSLITLAGNQTNATGATDIVDATNLVVADNIDYYTVSGTLAGVPGTITPNATTKVHTFTPATPGVYDIPPRSVFTPDTDHLRDRHVTIWMGRNDRWEPRAAQSITWAARHMVDYLTPRVKRVLVLQLVPGVEGLEHPQIKAINDMLKQEFPSQFVPIAEWMMTDEAATLAGITYTEQDLTDITEGRIPSSFRRDNAHFNEVGCIPIAHFLYREIQERGWL